MSVIATPFVFKPPEKSTEELKAPEPKKYENPSDLDINLDSDFTPSTPYVHKFRTEMCKNFELYGKCKYGDEVSWNFKFYSILFKMCIYNNS